MAAHVDSWLVFDGHDTVTGKVRIYPSTVQCSFFFGDGASPRWEISVIITTKLYVPQLV